MRIDPGSLDTANTAPEDSIVETTTAAHDARPQGLRLAWEMGRSAVLRFAVLGISALLGILTTRLVIDTYGQAAYAQYALLVTIGSLIPFADLGIGAAVMNIIGESTDPRADERVERVLLTSLRVTCASSFVLVAVAAAITATGTWSAVLGDGLSGRSGPLVALICVVLFSITLPLGLGERVLIALGRNHISIVVLGLQSPLVLGVLVLAIRLRAPNGSFVAVLPYAALVLLAFTLTVMAARRVRPALGRAWRSVGSVRSVRGGRILDTAWPMLIYMVALPLAMQTDRLVLSHVSDLRNLAEYSLAAQMFVPIYAVTNAAGVILWPLFARARATGERAVSPIRVGWLFAGIAAALCAMISLLSPWLSSLASGGQIRLSIGLVLAFSLLMTLQALKYPIGMYMTDSRGLRFQAFAVVLMLPVNLGLSVALGRALGAVGPVLGSAVGVLLFQVVANEWYVRRRRTVST